jgi:hypothetical protein
MSVNAAVLVASSQLFLASSNPERQGLRSDIAITIEII